MITTARYIEDKQTFRPFSITIPIETIDAARALYAIFNYSPNTDLLLNTNLSSYVIKDLIKEFCGENDPYVCNEDEFIASGVTYQQFYMK